MDMMFIESRAIQQMGYDEGNQELHIVFKNGRRCVYMNVPEEHWHGMVNAHSRGGYLDANIKKAGFPFRYD